MDNSNDNNPSNDAVRKSAEAHSIQKHHNKKRIRQRYAADYREKYLRKHGKPANIRQKAIYKLRENLAVKKGLLISAGVTGIIIMIIMTAASSCGAVFTGGLSDVVSGSYQSKPEEIDAADLEMTRLEMELQQEIDSIEATNSGYDEYEYNLDPIGHDPFALAAYLTARHTDFTASQVQGEIDGLFSRVYTLSTSEREEARTRTVTKTDSRAIYDEESGIPIGFEDYEYEEEEEYMARILSVTLKAEDLGIIADADLTPDESDLKSTLMETKGMLQYYYSPLDLDWQSYIKSQYGYRKNPQTGDLEYHKGVDIAVPEGTPVYAAQDGSVTQAAYDGHYGNFIVIGNADSYMSKYAHLQSVTVSTGQSVSHGDVIGYTGLTGSSTGSELHLECLYENQHYNPVFYFENGEGSLYATDPDTGEYVPAEASGDAASLIGEAMKYRGYPYVWGGSTPGTSFDCSGFVSWCLNASGYADVGRQTAQGLYDSSNRISQGDARPGDLIFFTGTYNSTGAVSHVGIYLGNGQMIHAGDPIKISSINTPYWQSHFYSYGRI